MLPRVLSKRRSLVDTSPQRHPQRHYLPAGRVKATRADESARRKLGRRPKKKPADCTDWVGARQSAGPNVTRTALRALAGHRRFEMKNLTETTYHRIPAPEQRVASHGFKNRAAAQNRRPGGITTSTCGSSCIRHRLGTSIASVQVTVLATSVDS